MPCARWARPPPRPGSPPCSASCTGADSGTRRSAAAGWSGRAGCSTRPDPASSGATGSWPGSPATVRTPLELEHRPLRALDVADPVRRLGAAHPSAGRPRLRPGVPGPLADGFARLEEALASADQRRGAGPFAVSTTCCALLSACDRAGDPERAAEWLRIVRTTSSRRPGAGPRMLGAHCQVALGGVLCAVGEWTEAEEAVRVAVCDGGSGATAAQRAEAAARLADAARPRAGSTRPPSCSRPSRTSRAAAAPLARLHMARSSRTPRSPSSSGRVPSSVGRAARADLLVLTVPSRRALAALPTLNRRGPPRANSVARGRRRCAGGERFVPISPRVSRLVAADSPEARAAVWKRRGAPSRSNGRSPARGAGVAGPGRSRRLH